MKNKRVRQIHRWLAITFTVTVIITSVAMAAQEQPADWVVYLPLFPLAVLFVTGLTMFFQPYIAKWRGSQRTAHQ